MSVTEISRPDRPTLVRTMFSRASISRCLPVAAIVGTVLSLINQGNVVWAGHATVATWFRIAANYAMPFLVSSIGFFSSQLHQWRLAHSASRDDRVAA